MGNLINKIKLIWQGRSVAENLLQLGSRWREPTFWVALLGNLTTAIGAYQGLIPAEYTPILIIANSIITAGYNYVRGLQKAETDGVKPYSSSSEFYLGLATMANNALLDMHSGGISTAWVAASTVVLGHAIAAARDLANMRPKEVTAAGVVAPTVPPVK